MRDSYLYLHHYPRQEALAELLIKSLHSEGDEQPFYQSSVLVQSRGMATWLRQQITQQHGLCMQVNFPLPGSFLAESLPLFTSQNPSQLPSQSQLSWMIYSLLPKLLKQPGFKQIKSYLEDDSIERSQRKRLELSESLAAMYDRYQTYRSHWLIAWSEGQTVTDNSHEIWQKTLWLEIQKLSPTLDHWGSIIHRLQSRGIDALTPDLSKLPANLHVFGISNLPPCYIDFLHIISHYIPVHLYWMNPVEGYWEDAPNQKQWMETHAMSELDQVNMNNPLLATFGRLGREFISTLYTGTQSNYDWQEIDFTPQPPIPNKVETSLHHIQSDIYNNIHTPQLTVDTSVQIHSCHSPLREVEVLRQHLLSTIADSPTTDTSEFLILCPNIEDYVAAIEATFGTLSPDDPHYLPYRISDRTTPSREPSIQAFLELFQLPKSRFTSKDGLNLLGIELIAESFHIEASQLTLVRHWIEQTGIRWGIDREHVHELTDSKTPAHWSWESGLESLLLGVTMAGNDHADPAAQLLWKDILPYAQVEGDSLSLLESFSQFITWVKQTRKELLEERTLHEWIQWSQSLIDSRFSSRPEAETTMRPLRVALDALVRSTESLDLTEPFHAAVFHDHLSSLLHKLSPPSGFLSGSITFCEMSPMRAIPITHLAILGLSANNYPRKQHALPFDLTQIYPRVGDRSSREDEHYLFLEAILSARETLYLSYTGISIRDNTALPPSTVLQTLLDAYPSLQESIFHENIQAYAPDYFRATHTTPQSVAKLSYDKHLLHASKALIGEKLPDEPKLTQRHTKSSPSELSIQQLIQCFTQSSTCFLRHNYDTSNRWLDKVTQVDEAIELDPLGAYHIKQQIIENGDFSLQQCLAKQSLSQLPPSELGHSALQAITDSLETIRDSLPNTQTRQLSLSINQLKIEGTIDVQVDQPHIVQVTSSSSLKPAHYLRAWISMLLLEYSTKQPASAQLYGVKSKSNSKTKEIDIQIIESPGKQTKTYLEELTALALTIHQKPVPFFPKTSFSYAKQTFSNTEEHSEKSQNHIIQTALKDGWKDQFIQQQNTTIQGEGSQLDHLLLHNSQNPINEEFIRVSQMIWHPILLHLEHLQST